MHASVATRGSPSGSVVAASASNVASEHAAAAAAAAAGASQVPQPETTEEFAFSKALRESDETAALGGGRKSVAKKRRMTLGVRHDFESPAGGATASPAATAESPARNVDLNLSDSFEVPPGADAAAASVVEDGLTTHSDGAWSRDEVDEEARGGGGATGDGETDRLESRPDSNANREVPFEKTAARATQNPALLLTTTSPAAAPSSDAFSEPGTDTLRVLAKMKDDATGAMDPARLDAGETAETGVSEGGFTDPTRLRSARADFVTRTLTGASAFARAVSSGPPPFGTPSSGDSPYSSEGAVTPANPPPSDPGSDGDGFTPGPDTLLMMEKLKGRKHGDAGFDSARRTIGPGRLSAAAWIVATPLPPIGGAMGMTFAPNEAGTIAGGFAGGYSSADRATAFGGGSNGGAFRRTPFGDSTENVARGSSPFAPGAARRAALREAKRLNDARKLGGLGVPFEPSAAARSVFGDDSNPVELRDFFHACEVSFMDAKNLRRKSLATVSVCAGAPPETVAEALRLVCLTAPTIEAIDPMHDFLNASLANLASDIDRLRGEVESAQPPLLRLAASRDPAHQLALRDAGKMLKKQCQLVTKEDHARRRLETERSVAASLRASKRALRRVGDALAKSREMASEAAQCADVCEVDLKRRVALTGDAASRDAQRLCTRDGALLALAERRASVERLRSALASKNAEMVQAQTRRGETDAAIVRAEAALVEARAVAEASGRGDVLIDGGAGRRAASAARLRKLRLDFEARADALAVMNRIAPWRLERVERDSKHASEGASLFLRVGRFFRLAVDVGTGAGKVTLVPAQGDAGVFPAGAAAFVAAAAGAPRVWTETCPEARGGDARAVLQSVVPGLLRAEALLEEVDSCRAAFPRITRVVCGSNGDLELTFVDFQCDRVLRVALALAGGAYPRGALRPRVVAARAGNSKTRAALPEAGIIEAAIERVPAGEASRRLFGVCRLLDWICAAGEGGVGDAAREAAAAARAPPPAPPPDIFLGVANATLPAVRAGRLESGDARVEETFAEEAGAVAERAEEEGAAAAGAEAAGSGAPGLEGFETEKRLGSPSISVSAPLATPGTEWGEARAATVDAREGKEVAEPVANTPAGFQKGSNPLFDDSDEDAASGDLDR